MLGMVRHRYQWGLNQDMARILKLTPAGGLDVTGVVTPQISGLSNGNCLRAMTELGITCGTGDNTWCACSACASCRLPAQKRAAVLAWPGSCVSTVGHIRTLSAGCKGLAGDLRVIGGMSGFHCLCSQRIWNGHTTA
jgi:hypothetical protein